MKKYIFMTCIIGNIAGGQIYTRNKMKYVLKKGYEAYVFSQYGGPIYIKDFEAYSSFVKEELVAFPENLPKSTRNKVIDWMLKKIDYRIDDEIVIESQNIQLSCWGELLAKRTNGKNFVFLIGEKFGNRSIRKLSKFFDFKINRSEYCGITPKAVDNFLHVWRTDYNSGDYVLSAICSNSVEDVDVTEKTQEFIDDDGIKIGIIGRLSKQYFTFGLEGVLEYAKANQGVKISIILIGGGSPEDTKKFAELAKSQSNIKIYFTGFIYPIPRKIMKSLDICIGGAGSVYSSFFEMVPTLSMDLYANKVNGLMGYDFFSKKCDNNKKISDYIQLIISNKKNLVIDYSYRENPASDIEYHFNKHWDYLNRSSNKLEYYNKFKISPMDLIYRLCYRVNGINGIKNLDNHISSLTQKVLSIHKSKG